MRQLPESNLSYPVLIKTSSSTGSGFYYRKNKRIYLVTAKHVVYDTENLRWRDSKIQLWSYEFSNKSRDKLMFDVDMGLVQSKIHPKYDIAVLEVAIVDVEDNLSRFKTTLSPGVERKDKSKVGFMVVPDAALKNFESVLVSNDVYILGYPNSLGVHDQGELHIEYDVPLLRKGIVAGTNAENGTIILDCPVYFGNSGGLAIEVEKMENGNTAYRAIGIVTQYIPFVETLVSQELKYINKNVENSGYSVVVPIDAIKDLIGS